MFDLAAAYRAWQRGQYLDAALSGVAAVPLFGDAVKLVAVGLGGAVSATRCAAKLDWAVAREVARPRRGVLGARR